MKEPPSTEREAKMSNGKRSKKPIERILVFLFMQLNGHLISNLVELVTAPSEARHFVSSLIHDAIATVHC
jgi:hypothetical protein